MAARINARATGAVTDTGYTDSIGTDALRLCQPRQRTRRALAFEQHQGHATQAVDQRSRRRDTSDRHRAMQNDHYRIHHFRKPPRRPSQINHDIKP